MRRLSMNQLVMGNPMVLLVIKKTECRSQQQKPESEIFHLVINISEKTAKVMPISLQILNHTG